VYSFKMENYVIYNNLCSKPDNLPKDLANFIIDKLIYN